MVARRQLLAGLLATSAPPLAAQPAPGFDPTRLARLDGFMQAASAPGGYLGAVAWIGHRGRAVLHQAWGSRDLQRQLPMPRDAIFRIYSMSKTMASMAALLLMEEGRLALDDALALHLPEFAGLQVLAGGTADAPQLRAPARPVTLRHLLTHTAGFATGAAGQAETTRLMERAAPSAASDLAGYALRASRVPLAQDPGTRFTYDGVNTEVLCRALEVISGLPFATLLQQRLFDPLGLRDTGFTVPAAQRARIAELSAMGPDGRLVRGPGPSAREPGVALNAYSSGAGGLYSTASDYARFAQMLLDGGRFDDRRLLSSRSTALMMANHLAPTLLPANGLNAGEGFGLGGSVVMDPALRGRLGSRGAFGWSGAASTYYLVDPAEQLVALLLMQHLPTGNTPPELPRLQVKFFNLVYQALNP
jgi:CubicO group peptidase (beta-lactamase class C family)